MLETLLQVLTLVLVAVLLARIQSIEQKLDLLGRRERERARAPTEPKSIEVAPALQPQRTPVAPRPVEAPVAPAPVEKAAALTSAGPRNRLRYERQIGQRLLLLAGLVILITGIAYFLKYSIDQGWISPAVRVLMTYAGAGALIGVGEFARRQDYRVFGLSLVGGGCCSLYFAAFAGYQMYGLLPQSVAFVLAVMTTALACVLALLYDGKWLAVLGLAGGMLSPALFGGADGSTVGLFSYLLLLNSGILLIAFSRQWTVLNYLGMAFTWGNVLLWMQAARAPDEVWVPLGFQMLLFLTYAIAPFAYFMGQAREGTPNRGFLVIVPNALISLAVAAELLRGHPAGYLALVALAYAAVFLALAHHLHAAQPQARAAQSGLLVQGAFFLAIAVPMALDGPWITLSWALLGAALATIGRQVRHRLPVGASLFLAGCAWFRLMVFDYPAHFGQPGIFSAFQDGFLNLFFFRALIVAGVTWASIRILHQLRGHAALSEKDSFQTRRAGAVVISIVLFGIANREVAGLFLAHQPTGADAALSILWAVTAIGLLITGFVRGWAPVRVSGLVLFALAALKIFFVDMADASTPARIVSFIGVGLVLIIGSFLYYRFKEASGEMAGAGKQAP